MNPEPTGRQLRVSPGPVYSTCVAYLSQQQKEQRQTTAASGAAFVSYLISLNCAHGHPPNRIYLASFDYFGGRYLPLPSNRGWSRENDPAPTVASAKLPASMARGNS